MLSKAPAKLTDSVSLTKRIVANSCRVSRSLSSKDIERISNYFSFAVVSGKVDLNKLKAILRKFNFTLLDETSKIAVIMSILNIKLGFISTRNFEFKVAAKVLNANLQYIRMFISELLKQI